MVGSEEVEEELAILFTRRWDERLYCGSGPEWKVELPAEAGLSKDYMFAPKVQLAGANREAGSCVCKSQIYLQTYPRPKCCEIRQTFPGIHHQLSEYSSLAKTGLCTDSTIVERRA